MTRAPAPRTDAVLYPLSRWADHSKLWIGIAIVLAAKGGRHGRRAAPCRLWLIFIGNCEYEPGGLAPRWRPRLDDAMFDVRYVDGTNPLARTRLVLALLTGQLGRSKVYKRMVVPSLRVTSKEGPLRLARDGETFDGGTDVRVEKHPRPLGVVVLPG